MVIFVLVMVVVVSVWRFGVVSVGLCFRWRLNMCC